MPEFRNLDARQIVTTVEVLARRIEERFPDANLNKVAREVVRVARGAAERVEALSQPNVPLRAGVWLLVAGAVGVLFLMVPALRLSVSPVMQTRLTLSGGGTPHRSSSEFLRVSS